MVDMRRVYWPSYYRLFKLDWRFMKTIQYKETGNHPTHVPLQESGMLYTGLDIYTLKEDETFAYTAGADRELCVVLLSGYIDCTLAGEQYQNLGNRDSVFSDTVAYALYVSANDHFEIKAKSAVEIAVCEGWGSGKYASHVIDPKPSYIEHRGYGAMQRTAKNILPELDEAESLLIVEVITEGGNWSSFPSHRHDEDDLPHQSNLEEIYYHRVSNPEGGFAFQRVYNDDQSLDEAYVLKDGCVVLVREGYHPVAVPPGNDVYYLNVMAGPKRTWKFHNDPHFEHLIK